MDETRSLDALDDLATMVDILREVVLDRRPERLNAETRQRLERAVERSTARERARGQPFLRRVVHARLRQGEHRDLRHQQG